MIFFSRKRLWESEESKPAYFFLEMEHNFDGVAFRLGLVSVDVARSLE